MQIILFKSKRGPPPSPRARNRLEPKLCRTEQGSQCASLSKQHQIICFAKLSHAEDNPPL
ncbi:hypothetical protein GOP47_0015344 [Adiantum capillus-veneris]|uniref:Uncharacterized protein n=1 Tax=Adiantum capillus-veneris TaxID=13818 RepID=A0A9D4UJG7_ADICA|nr:hypothetical protein GOP47_0015344 [Adiantum capillus-veneris]